MNDTADAPAKVTAALNVRASRDRLPADVLLSFLAVDGGPAIAAVLLIVAVR